MTEPRTEAGRRLVEGDRDARFTPDQVEHLVLLIESEAGGVGWEMADRLRAEVWLTINKLEQAGWPHEYDRGIHRMPGCRGCQLLSRFRALGAVEKPEWPDEEPASWHGWHGSEPCECP